MPRPVRGPQDPVALTAAIIGAYVSHNAVTPHDLPSLILHVHAALTGAHPPVPDAPRPERPSAQQIAASIEPEALVSFINGRRYKTLKRHLALRGLDAVAYRQRYGLPADYPMTATAYSFRRAQLAKGITHAAATLPHGRV